MRQWLCIFLVLAAGSTLAAQYDAVFPEPVAFYAFEQQEWPGPGSVIDSSGNDNNGSPLGAVSPLLAVPQVSCRVLDVESNSSADDIFAVDTGIDVNSLGNAGTISFWYRSDNQWGGSPRQLLDASSTASDPDKYFFLAMRSDGSLRFALEDSANGALNATTGAFSFDGDDWVHIAVTWSLPSGQMQIYLNGFEQPITLDNSLESSTLGQLDSLYIGDNRSGYFENDSSANSANGQFDDVRIYKVVQTADQIEADRSTLSPCSAVDHYLLVHDGQGITCEAESMFIVACANPACTSVYTGPASVELSPDGWLDNPVSFAGLTDLSLAITEPGSYALSLVAASPNAPLQCSPNCNIEFVDAGLAFFDTSTGLPALSSQIAQESLSDIGIRAVRDNDGVCAALLEGSQTVSLGYDCISPPSNSYSPDVCRVPFAGVPVQGNGAGVSSGAISLTFDAEGQTSLAGFSYADAGRLAISASTEVEGVTFSTGETNLDVVPSALLFDTSELGTPKHIAGESFTLTISALGAAGSVLPGYQPGLLQLAVTRIQPGPGGVDGRLFYADGDSVSSALSPVFSNAVGLTFSNGTYQYTSAYYSEVGAATIDIRDNDYLGVIINAVEVSFGQFRPAYFDVEQISTPSLDNAHGLFTYVGQEFGFDAGAEPVIQVTAKNARGDTTFNYAGDLWRLRPNQVDVVSHVSYFDRSIYPGTATTISAGDTPVLADTATYDGQALLQINNASFRYNKTDAGNIPFGPVSPFYGIIDMLYAEEFLTDEDGVCWQPSYPGSCESFIISDITGNSLRYGRLNLQNTYGPEIESLFVPIIAEYYQDGEWRRNSLDDLTPINYSEAASQVQIEALDLPDISSLAGSPVATGLLNSGLSNDDDLLLSAPGEGNTGTLRVWLDPSASDALWSEYLNDDWDGDGDIDNDDFPEAIVTFGLFRGNDRVIHWREVNN